MRRLPSARETDRNANELNTVLPPGSTLLMQQMLQLLESEKHSEGATQESVLVSRTKMEAVTARI